LVGSLFHDEDWVSSLFQISPNKPSSTQPEPDCPECGHKTRRARRKGLQRIFFFARAYRCSDCEYRFLRFR
jgi:DNA-directed RNA polymerase subunit RPC12/RpoP